MYNLTDKSQLKWKDSNKYFQEMWAWTTVHSSWIALHFKNMTRSAYLREDRHTTLNTDISMRMILLRILKQEPSLPFQQSSKAESLPYLWISTSQSQVTCLGYSKSSSACCLPNHSLSSTAQQLRPTAQQLRLQCAMFHRIQLREIDSYCSEVIYKPYPNDSKLSMEPDELR